MPRSPSSSDSKTESAEGFAQSLLQARASAAKFSNSAPAALSASLPPAAPTKAPEAKAPEVKTPLASIEEDDFGFSSSLPRSSQPAALDSLPRNQPATLESRPFAQSIVEAETADTDDEASPAKASYLADSPDPDWNLGEAEPLETPEFIRAAQRRAYWRKPGVRLTLYVLALLLTLALALQVVVFKRDYIAAAAPQSKPYLTQLCAYLACTVEPWRSTQSLILDESSFSKVRDTQYRVSVGLRNKARVPVATPHILLSLNDQDGQVLVRRVFKPNELGLPTHNLNASAEVSGQAVVEIENNELANEIVGYKLLIFYP